MNIAETSSDQVGAKGVGRVLIVALLRGHRRLHCSLLHHEASNLKEHDGCISGCHLHSRTTPMVRGDHP